MLFVNYYALALIFQLISDKFQELIINYESNEELI
jgi:hypothetical protein